MCYFSFDRIYGHLVDLRIRTGLFIVRNRPKLLPTQKSYGCEVLNGVLVKNMLTRTEQCLFEHLKMHRYKLIFRFKSEKNMKESRCCPLYICLLRKHLSLIVLLVTVSKQGTLFLKWVSEINYSRKVFFVCVYGG